MQCAPFSANFSTRKNALFKKSGILCTLLSWALISATRSTTFISKSYIKLTEIVFKGLKDYYLVHSNEIVQGAILFYHALLKLHDLNTIKPEKKIPQEADSRNPMMTLHYQPLTYIHDIPFPSI